VGRVWPRHEQRGRPLNAIVIRHEVAAVIDFAKSHIATLRAVVLGGVLAYVALTFAWVNLSWRTHASHQLGSIFFLGSLPWSIPWVTSELRWLVPPPLGHIATTLIVGLALGVNAAIAVVVSGYVAARLKVRGASLRKRS
jgi:hypothetical protein